MDRVARLPSTDRSDLFRETAARRAINPAVAEKDFWVCWVLKHLFADAILGKRLVFIGGTSLSKVFGLIDRFSEDVDLILDWRLLGYRPGQEDPFGELTSATQRDRFNKRLNEKAAGYIADQFRPRLAEVFSACPEVVAGVDRDDPHTVAGCRAVPTLPPMGSSRQYRLGASAEVRRAQPSLELLLGRLEAVLGGLERPHQVDRGAPGGDLVGEAEGPVDGVHEEAAHAGRDEVG